MKPHRAAFWIHAFLLLLLTEAIYVQPAMLTGRASLIGLDYIQLHARRITFARTALFGPNHDLPAWYPHELLGAPFAANLQNFPWIPTRLVLLLLDPSLAYGWAVAIAAALAALFTFLYCRRSGLSDTASAVAGWTFACAGYFACRVTAGHLPLLEAYPALPMLLWLCDRAISADREPHRARDLVLLAIGCACVALAGHPQVPAYALSIAFLYVVVRARRRVRLVTLATMVLGIGMTMAAWWPMLLLVQRSTRVLDLAEPSNNISLPYGRLLALLRPGIDGWPDIIDLSDQHEFDGYPSDAYFWDTTAYVGLLPLGAILALLIRAVIQRRMPDGRWLFFIIAGTGALLVSLPLADPLREAVPGTFLRSPARLLYLSTFAAAIALACGVNILLNSGHWKRRAVQAAVAVCILFHIGDLGGFARIFVQTTDRQPPAVPPFARILDREVGDGRVALSGDLVSRYNDRYDDVGVFDSVLLANPYRAILGLNGDPADLNTQRLDGSELRPAALQAAGARFVATTEERKDLELVERTTSNGDDCFLYRVADAAPRASFFPAARTDFVPRQKALSTFLSRGPGDKLVVPSEARTHLSLTPVAFVSVQRRDTDSVEYLRPSSDEIRVETATDTGGFVQVLESYDPGWKATVDRAAVPVLPANGFSIAVPVAPGRHTVRLNYHTQGRTTGWILSLCSAAFLLVLVRLTPVPRSDATSVRCEVE